MKLKPETYVGLALLTLFILATGFAYDIMQQVVYMIGCFAVGWNIPNVSKFLVNYWRTYITKKPAQA